MELSHPIAAATVSSTVHTQRSVGELVAGARVDSGGGLGLWTETASVAARSAHLSMVLAQSAISDVRSGVVGGSVRDTGGAIRARTTAPAILVPTLRARDRR